MYENGERSGYRNHYRLIRNTDRFQLSVCEVIQEADSLVIHDRLDSIDPVVQLGWSPRDSPNDGWGQQYGSMFQSLIYLHPKPFTFLQ